MKCLRIIHIIDTIHQGGGELFFQELLNHLDQSKIEFICSLVIDGANKGNFKLPIPVIDTSTDIIPLKREADAVLFWGRVGNYLQEFQDIPIRIFMAHSDFNVGWYMESARYANYALAVSEGVRAAIQFPRCRVIYPRIDLDSYTVTKRRDDLRAELGFQSQDFVIGTFGRMIQYKNIETTIEAVAQLDRRVKLLLIGDGAHLGKLLEICEEKIPGRYRHIHHLSNDVIGDYYSAIDAFCSMSKGEGFPRVMWESMLFGKPFISTPVGVVPTLIKHRKNGFIVNSSQEVIDVVKELLQNRQLYLEMATHTQAFARSQGDISICANEFTAYLQDIYRSSLAL